MDSATERAPDPPPTPGSDRRRRISPRSRLAAVVLVAVLAGASYGGWLVLQHHKTDVGAVRALAAAEKYVLTLTNFDSVHPDPADEKDMDYLLDGATGGYRAMYERSQGKLLKLQVEKKAVGRGTLVDSAIKSATKDQVVAVLLVDQAVTNTDTPDPQLDRSRLRVTMDKVDGRWLVGYLEVL